MKKRGIFDNEYNTEIIEMDNIQMISLCQHHLLPFIGNVSVKYKPDKKIIGLSKIPKIIEMCSKRLQLQEKLTQNILDNIYMELHEY